MVIWSYQNFHKIKIKELFLGFRVKTKISKITLEYKKGLALDIFLSHSETVKETCILVVHGGGWESGDKVEAGWINKYFADKGYIVASMNYRLAPQNKFPAPVQDVEDALKYLRTYFQDKKESIKNFILLGRSAGAQIILYKGFARPETDIRALVDFYGPTNLGDFDKDHRWWSVLNSEILLKNYLGGSLKTHLDAYVGASPCSYINKDVPPTLIFHGAKDELVSVNESRKLASKLKEVGAKVEYIELPWATHALDFFSSGLSGQIALYKTQQFIETILSQK
ncbi:MAG: alpha/beta hydrolase [Bacteriovoracaceae bacterium]|nr:alpha/beta hydrolase [Bacteriovoracaceae bacterium]